MIRKAKADVKIDNFRILVLHEREWHSQIEIFLNYELS